MFELVLMLFFGILMYFVTKTIIRVVMYLVIYNVISSIVYSFISGVINLDSMVSFLISRIFFFLLTLKIGNILWDFAERFKIIQIILLGLFAYIVYSMIIQPPQGYFYHQMPSKSIMNYI